jgi:2-keto-3-deoxy-6-phosphogluconate aldolase
MNGGKPLAALLRAKVDAADEISITKVTTLKEGFMTITEFENSLGYHTVKVFPTESSAKAYAAGERILKVKLEREL